MGALIPDSITSPAVHDPGASRQKKKPNVPAPHQNRRSRATRAKRRGEIFGAGVHGRVRILGIETSCDETAVCVIDADGEFGTDFKFEILGNALISQTAVHSPYGGVFPNLAKREHGRNLVPLLQQVLHQSQKTKSKGQKLKLEVKNEIRTILERETELCELLIPFLEECEKPEIDAIAATHGPGLEPALWVGVNFAKALSAAWGIPIVPINHMEAHIVLSVMDFGNILHSNVLKNFGINRVRFPMLSLLISGGHTELVLSREWMQYELIGQTRDDAVGEAFDKVARLLGLPYPGGPHISALAEISRKNAEYTQNNAEEIPRQSAFDPHPSALSLPRPMIDSDNFDFSFAGLKTAVRKVVEAHQPLDEKTKMAIALEFENACADVLVAKTMRAIEEYGAATVLVGGGVSANTHIRESLAQSIKDYGYGTKLLIPPPELATDNALMIALAGYFRAQRGEFADPDSIRAQGNLKLHG